MMIRYVALALLGVLLVPLSAVYAQSQELGFLPNVQGEYENPEAGLKIVFPEGWRGVQLYGGLVMIGPDGVNPDPNARPDALMFVFAQNRTAFAESITKYDSSSTEVKLSVCKDLETSYTTINQISAFKTVQECNDGTNYEKSSTVAVITDKQYVILSFSAKSVEVYDKHAPAFEKSLETLTVQGAQDFHSASASLLQLKPNYYKVSIPDKNVDVTVESNGSVTDFGFDTEKKQVSFKMDGQTGVRGVTVIDAHKALEGPFTVLVDGKATDEFSVIQDKNTGNQVMQIYYDDASHDVAIIGTKVVPEFPAVLVGVLASVMGAVILLSRKFGRRA